VHGRLDRDADVLVDQCAYRDGLKLKRSRIVPVTALPGGRLILHCINRKNAPFLFFPHDRGRHQPNTKAARCSLGLPPLRRDDGIVWVHNHGDPCGCRCGFPEKFEAFLGQISGHVRNTRHVATWPG